jgi:transcriptional regulator with XRE-family HTH domain
VITPAKKNGAQTRAPMYDFSVLRGLRKRANLTMEEVSERSGVSVAVISKLERNQSCAELETLFKLSRVFRMRTTDLLGLAESQTAQKTTVSEHQSSGFHFQEISYGNVRCLHGTAKAGSKVSRPEIHEDDYEVCWVLKGAVSFILPDERYELSAGEAIQFDAILEHTYEAVRDSEVIILHLRKGKRF